MRWYFIGLFCNLAPISTVGSDVIRGLGLANETGHKPKIFASIVLDRLSGFAGIVILAAVAFLFGHGIIANKLVIIAIAVDEPCFRGDRGRAFQPPDLFFCLQGFCGMAQGQRKSDEIAL